MNINYKLSLTLKDIPRLVENILEKLEPVGIYGDILYAIRLSLEEALINAVTHGNKMDSNKNIFLTVRALPESLEIEVKDEGEGFDYERLPLPTDKENLEKTYGRGIFLIRHFMDKVEFLEGGSKIKMVKYLKNSKGIKNEDN